MTTDSDTDWYEVLGCAIGASKEVIATVARNLSRKYHPDKNKAPEAAEKFLMIQKAKEILLDDTKRQEIEDKLRAKHKRKAHENQRNQNMNEKKRKMREELEKQVNQHKSSFQQPSSSSGKSHSDASRHSKAYVDQLRRDAEERMAAASEEAAKSAHQRQQQYTQQKEYSKKNYLASLCKTQIKVKWRKSRESHSEDSLYQLFKVFGDIEEIKLSTDSGTSATITFTHEKSVQLAVREYDISTEYKVTSVEEKLKKKADVFTVDYSQYNNSSRGSGSGMSTGSGGSSYVLQESQLMKEAKRAFERAQLLKELERQEGISSTTDDRSGSSSSSFSKHAAAHSNSGVPHVDAADDDADDAATADTVEFHRNLLQKIYSQHRLPVKCSNIHEFQEKEKLVLQMLLDRIKLSDSTQ